jgi:hypothetical protein
VPFADPILLAGPIAAILTSWFEGSLSLPAPVPEHLDIRPF